MAVAMAAYPQQFQQQVQTNLRYWRNWLAKQQDNLPQLEQERDSLLRAVRFALKLPDIWAMTVELIINFSPYMERWGHWDIWANVLHQTVAVARRVEDSQSEVILLLLLARVRFQQSQFPQMVSAYRQVIRLARRIGDNYNLARACTNLGFYYVEKRYWWQAEVLCCRALALFEALDSSHGLAHTHNHLGVLHLWQERWNEAEDHLQQAVHLWREMGDTANLTRGLNNLGVLFNGRLKPELALPFLQEAESCAKNVGDENEMGMARMNMGIAYREMRVYPLAEQYLWQAHTVFDRLQNEFRLALVLDNLGLFYTDCHKWAKAEAHLTGALARWRGLNNSYYELQTMILLGEYEYKRGRLDQAQQWLFKAERLLVLYGSARRYRDLWRRLEEVQQKNLGQPAATG